MSIVRLISSAVQLEMIPKRRRNVDRDAFRDEPMAGEIPQPIIESFLLQGIDFRFDSAAQSSFTASLPFSSSPSLYIPSATNKGDLVFFNSKASVIRQTQCRQSKRQICHV